MSVCISACPGLLSCILLACPRLYVHVSMAASLHGVHACMFKSACLQVCVSMSKSMPDFFTILLVPVITHKSQACLHIHVCMSVNACLHVHVCLAACLHVHLDFFHDFAPVIPQKSQVMSAYPCLHVHICIMVAGYIEYQFFNFYGAEKYKRYIEYSPPRPPQILTGKVWKN